MPQLAETTDHLQALLPQPPPVLGVSTEPDVVGVTALLLSGCPLLLLPFAAGARSDAEAARADGVTGRIQLHSSGIAVNVYRRGGLLRLLRRRSKRGDRELFRTHERRDAERHERERGDERNSPHRRDRLFGDRRNIGGWLGSRLLGGLE